MVITTGTNAMAKYNRMMISGNSGSSLVVNSNGAIAVSGSNRDAATQGGNSTAYSSGGGGSSSSGSSGPYTGQNAYTLNDVASRAPAGKQINPAYVNWVNNPVAGAGPDYYIDIPTPAAAPVQAPVIVKPATQPVTQSAKSTVEKNPDGTTKKAVIIPATSSTKSTLIPSEMGKPLLTGLTTTAAYNRYVQAQAKSQGKDTLLDTSTGKLSIKPTASGGMNPANAGKSASQQLADDYKAKLTAASPKITSSSGSSTSTVAANKQQVSNNKDYQAALANGGKSTKSPSSSGSTATAVQPTVQTTKSASSGNADVVQKAVNSSLHGHGSLDGSSNVDYNQVRSNILSAASSGASATTLSNLAKANTALTNAQNAKDPATRQVQLNEAKTQLNIANNSANADKTNASIGGAIRNFSGAVVSSISNSLKSTSTSTPAKVSPQASSTKALVTPTTSISNLILSGKPSNFSTATKTAKTTPSLGDGGIGKTSANISNSIVSGAKNIIATQNTGNVPSSPKVSPQSSGTKTSVSPTTAISKLVIPTKSSNFATATPASKGTNNPDTTIPAIKSFGSAVAKALTPPNSPTMSSSSQQLLKDTLGGGGSLENVPSSIITKGNMSNVNISSITSNVNKLAAANKNNTNIIAAQKSLAQANADKSNAIKQQADLANAKQQLSIVRNSFK